jgi:hypothetical protein
MNRETSPTELELLDEQLVAYLDGELDDATARDLEERLARDTQVRDRLRELSGSWDLLDALPRAMLDDKFARTTVEMVSLAASEDLANEQLRTAGRKRRRWMLGAICALAAAMIGFAAFMFAFPNPNAELLADLSLVENLDAYDAVDSVDFIRQLHAAGVFGDDVADMSARSEGEQTAPAAEAAVDDLDARRERLLAMDTTQKQELRRKFDRFQAFPEEKQGQLRELDRGLRSDPEAAGLLETLRQYHGWLLMHSPLERSDLQKMPADARLARIRQLKRDETDRLVVGLSDDERKLFDLGPLTDKDLKTVFDWSHDTVLRQKNEILREVRGHDRDWVESAPDKQEESRRLFIVAMQRRGGPPKVTDIPESDWDALLAKLSTGTRSELAKEEPEKLKQAAQLHRWVVGTMQARFAARAGVTREDLIKVYNELDANVRRGMADLPPEDLYRRLMREHMLRQGKQQGPWWGPGGDKQPGPPPEFGARRHGPPREDGDRRDGEDRGWRDGPRGPKDDSRRDDPSRERQNPNE